MRPAIDYVRLKELVSMDHVLALLHWRMSYRCLRSRRGPCPLHGSTSRTSGVFEVTEHGYHCWKCGRRGDQVHLWAELHGLDDYAAAVALCGLAGVAVPYLSRRPRKPRPPRERRVRRCAGGSGGVSPPPPSE